MKETDCERESVLYKGERSRADAYGGVVCVTGKGSEICW